MKSLILDIQKDLFESSVLEQSAEIKFVSVDEALGMKGVPCVLLGSKGIDDLQAPCVSWRDPIIRRGPV